MLKSKSISVDKTDYFRTLITETIPYETPVIFSNDGFYLRSKEASTSANSVYKLIFSRLVEGEEKNSPNYTIPYLYKVRKTSLEYRRLALVHPIAQWRMMKFYRRYEKLITYFCQNSDVSLRSPHRVASSFFQKNSLANINQYKHGGVQDTQGELYNKHSSSFFAYSGVDRLYKFFDSNDFLKLEKRWSSLWSMDVSKCFDSIYTHSITWATKEKSFIKKNISSVLFSTFGNDFDELMQKSNYNETNGIVIGPEISRIFAEIIFQRIDAQVANLVRDNKDEKLSTSFEVRRYVDDIYIFANNDETAKKIFEIYSAELQKFNLHVNKSKTIKHARPFFTKKSQIISDVNVLINEFFDKFLEKPEEKYELIPKEIFKELKLSRSFIDAVKSVCIVNAVTYDDVSSYIIGAFFERIKKIISINSIKEEKSDYYKSALSVITEVLFFFYTASPSVSASYKLCASIILTIRFSNKNLEQQAATIKQRIYELGVELFQVGLFSKNNDIDNIIRLESINVVLAMSEMGSEYLLPPDVVSQVFLGFDRFSYFDIISCLFYVRDFPQYSELKKFVIDQIEERFKDISEIEQHAEVTCLFLDVIGCPYIEGRRKAKWVQRYTSHYGGTSIPTSSDIHKFVGDCGIRPWFVNWNEIDLLNALERKELKRAY
ncbi:antiviral reverse transcriptase Drt3b [Janthinobacterium aestuarii]